MSQEEIVKNILNNVFKREILLFSHLSTQSIVHVQKSL